MVERRLARFHFRAAWIRDLKLNRRVRRRGGRRCWLRRWRTWRGILFVLFCLATLLFLVVALSLGILISIAGKSQFVASQFAMVATLLPAFLLSGFVFPIENMPLGIQFVTYIVPLRYFLVILRGVYLKGTGFAELWPQFVAMALIAGTALAFATNRFRRSIA